MNLDDFPIGALLHELDGKAVIPPLTRTQAGWGEPQAPNCSSCSNTRILVGWVACSCRRDTFSPGHRTWTCANCYQVTRLGCVNKNANLGPLEEYGCAPRLEHPRPATTHPRP